MTIQLGGGSFIAINEKTTTSTSITERVLHVHLAGARGHRRRRGVGGLQRLRSVRRLECGRRRT